MDDSSQDISENPPPSGERGKSEDSISPRAAANVIDFDELQRCYSQEAEAAKKLTAARLSSEEISKANLSALVSGYRAILRTIDFSPIFAGMPASTGNPSDDMPDLYMYAAMAYVTDPRIVSIESLAGLPKLWKLDISKLRDWAVEGQWRKIRNQFLSAWAAETAAHLSAELLITKLDELKALQQAQTQAMSLLVSTPPKSWEGVVKSITLIGERQEALSRELQSRIGSLAPASEVSSPNVVTISRQTESPDGLEFTDVVQKPDSKDPAELSEDTIQELTLSIFKRSRKEVKEFASTPPKRISTSFTKPPPNAAPNFPHKPKTKLLPLTPEVMEDEDD